MKKMLLGMMLAVGTLAAAHGAQAQAPAGAPAGAMGICKDGTYSMQAKKDGACRGHKGVQTWYAASTAGTAAPATASTPAPKPVPTAPVTRPAAVPQVQQPAAPTTTSGTAAATGTGKRLSPEAAAAAKPQAAGGGPGLVWVNTASNVYHCNGDPFYGKTKAGKYMSESDAKAAGAHGERGKSCTGK